ncbi:MAG TPA: thioredoxin fold domain-containing protein [Flavisolibacter sp.]|nr:thioredoxin fold domain-containing protein [Flavisolibacter sp.]
MKADFVQFVKNKTFRKWSLVIFLGIILSGISGLFWIHELKYQMPTPVPANYKDVKPGSPISLAPQFAVDPQKPLFLHFFNPDCPCSKFNTKHFKELVKQYGQQVEFAIVTMAPDEQYTAKDIQSRFDLDLPVSFDTTLAATCGVYSTPQAVIIDKGKLYFRGNYNKSRFCTDPATNYAQMAIDSLLQQKQHLNFDDLAFRAYGCELPVCKK